MRCKRFQDYINIISCFEGEQARMYWIIALDTDDCMKGRLVDYFGIYRL